LSHAPSPGSNVYLEFSTSCLISPQPYKIAGISLTS
jgi:hypothetical protein